MSQTLSPAGASVEPKTEVVISNRVDTVTTRSALASKGWLKTCNHLLRRTHLYAGLLLLPWVFLYGITALLFNHNTLFSDVRIVTFGKEEMQGTSLADAPTAAQVAKQVIATINAGHDTKYTLVDPTSARYERGGLSASVKDASGTTFNVLIDPQGKGGIVRESRERPVSTEPAPFAAKKDFEVVGLPTKVVEQGLPEVLAKAGLKEPTVTEVRMPPLTFKMQQGNEEWQVNYNSQAGSIAGQKVDTEHRPELSTRAFLLRLHTTHHYPSEFNMKWAWAIIVDAMAVLMVFWGLSGIIMWVQIKRTRRLGMALLGISLIVALWVGFGMHALLLAGMR